MHLHHLCRLSLLVSCTVRQTCLTHGAAYKQALSLLSQWPASLYSSGVWYPIGDIYTSCLGKRHNCQLLTPGQQALVEGNAGLPFLHATPLQAPQLHRLMQA